MRSRVLIVFGLAMLVVLAAAAPAMAFSGVVTSAGCGLGSCHSRVGFTSFATWHDSHRYPPIGISCEVCHPNNHTSSGPPSAPDATYSVAEACHPCHTARTMAPTHRAASVTSCVGCHPASGTLSGRVNGSSGLLVGVTIAIGALPPVQTWAGGEYIAANVPVGTYDVTYTKTGYVSWTMAGVVVTDGGSTIQDVTLVAVPVIDIAPPATTSNAASSYVANAGITLTAFDIGGSGVAATYYRLDGAGQVTGSTVSVSGVGPHTLEFWSVDGAGNVEAHTIVTFTITAPAGGTTPVYRFYNFRKGVHFYTASESEKDNVVATLFSTFRFEGVAYYVNAANPDNDAPLYRFYNFKQGVHFYTASEDEKNNVLATLSSAFRFEGVAYHVSPDPAGMPVYRFYNFRKGAHFYTASEDEKNTILATLASTFRYEGVAYYIAP